MQQEGDSRSMIAKAWGWGYQAVSISLEMVIPGLIGLWIDRMLGTIMLFLVLGVVFGMTAGMIHLVQFARHIGQQGKKETEDACDGGKRP